METKNTQADQASKASDFQQTAPILAPSAGQRALNPNTLNMQNRQITVVGPPADPNSPETFSSASTSLPLFVVIALLLAATGAFLVSFARIMHPVAVPIPNVDLVPEPKKRKKR